MKRFPLLLLIALSSLIIIIILIVIFPSSSLVSETLPIPESLSPPPPPTSFSPLASRLNDTANSPEQDLEILHSLIQEFIEIVKEPNRPPLGLNEDVVKALTGQNRMQLATIPTNHPAISSNGQLTDRWGSPYFIHPRSADAFEVRSAGPDKTLFTTDDITR